MLFNVDFKLEWLSENGVMVPYLTKVGHSLPFVLCSSFTFSTALHLFEL